MSKADEFFDSLQYDDEDQVVWPEDQDGRRRVADGLFGSKVLESVDSAADEMLAHADGRWPEPGSDTYEADAKVAALFKSMSAEQRLAVQHVITETARLAAFSIFLGLEHFGPGRVAISVLPISRGQLADEPVPIEVIEWQHAYLKWEDRFAGLTRR